MYTILQNVELVLPNEILPFVHVGIEKGKIVKIDATPISTPKEYQQIDCKGHRLIPGMIDVHIHGAHGFDMMDGREEGIQEVSRTCASTGCTSFLATSVSSTIEDL